MQTLYMDSQVFRYLKSPEKYPDKANEINSLQQALEKIDDFLIFFSHAHLLDLQRDLSDKKISDLEFMETIVNDNYLIRYFKQKHVQYLLKTPRVAFEEVATNHSYSMYNNMYTFDFLSDADDPLIKSMWNLLMGMWDSIELPGIDDYSSVNNPPAEPGAFVCYALRAMSTYYLRIILSISLKANL